MIAEVTMERRPVNPRTPKIRIEKPEVSAAGQSGSGPKAPTIGIFFKLLIALSYLFSVASLCLACRVIVF